MVYYQTLKSKKVPLDLAQGIEQFKKFNLSLIDSDDQKASLYGCTANKKHHVAVLLKLERGHLGAAIRSSNLNLSNSFSGEVEKIH